MVYDEVDSWEPVDLTDYVSGKIVAPTPSVGAPRTDGVQFLYPGKEHALVGETEAGKSFFALACVSHEIHLDPSAMCVYIHFEEANPIDTVKRLLGMHTDPDILMDQVVFVGPGRPIDDVAMARLVDFKPRLVILDGVNEAMALHGVRINDPEGTAAFRRKMVKPFTAIGAAVLSLDHLVKDSEAAKQGYSFGSVMKVNALDGCQLLLRNLEPFGEGRIGTSILQVMKDRPAQLRKHGTPSEVPRIFNIAKMVIDSQGEDMGFYLLPPNGCD